MAHLTLEESDSFIKSVNTKNHEIYGAVQLIENVIRNKLNQLHVLITVEHLKYYSNRASNFLLENV